MRLRTVGTIFLAVVLAFASIAANAADFVIYTQNLLDFGQGGTEKRTAKCGAIDSVSQRVDLILIPAVMQQAYPCASIPAGFIWESRGPLGATAYKEFSRFLWRKGKDQRRSMSANEARQESLKDLARIAANAKRLSLR